MYTEILLSRLKELQEELKIHEVKIMNQVYELNEVRRNILRLEEDSLNEIAAKILHQTQELYQDASKMKMLRVALQKIISAYETCETNILNLDEGNFLSSIGKLERIDLRPLLKKMDQLQLDFVFQLQEGKE